MSPESVNKNYSYKLISVFQCLLISQLKNKLFGTFCEQKKMGGKLLLNIIFFYESKQPDLVIFSKTLYCDNAKEGGNYLRLRVGQPLCYCG